MEEKILNKVKNDFIKKLKIKKEVILSYDEENFLEDMEKEGKSYVEIMEKETNGKVWEITLNHRGKIIEYIEL